MKASGTSEKGTRYNGPVGRFFHVDDEPTAISVRPCPHLANPYVLLSLDSLHGYVLTLDDASFLASELRRYVKALSNDGSLASIDDEDGPVDRAEAELDAWSREDNKAFRKTVDAKASTKTDEKPKEEIVYPWEVDDESDDALESD